MGETWEVGNREYVRTGVWTQEFSLIASRSDNPFERSEFVIMEVATPCARLRVYSLAARTPRWFEVSTGPCSRFCQRYVTSGYVVFRLWRASDGKEPCSLVFRRGLMPTGPRTLRQRFRGDRRVLQCLGEVGRDSAVQDTGGCLLLAMKAVTLRLVAHDLVPEPTRDFFS